MLGMFAGMFADVGKEPAGSLHMTQRMSDVDQSPREEGGLERRQGLPPFKKEERKRHREWLAGEEARLQAESGSTGARAITVLSFTKYVPRSFSGRVR